MKITIESYWKVQVGLPATYHPMHEVCQFQKVSLDNPKGVDIPGYPGEKFMHLSTATGVRVIPASFPDNFNPLTLPVIPGALQITKSEYDAMILAMRQANPSYNPNDYT